MAGETTQTFNPVFKERYAFAEARSVSPKGMRSRILAEMLRKTKRKNRKQVVDLVNTGR